jgi:hypothetical protein
MPMNTSEIVDVIKWLHLWDKLPEIDCRYRIVLDSHSTADTVKISVVLDKEELLVWYKTNWYCTRYEFNENGKKIGFQVEGPWVDYLTQYFERCKQAKAEKLDSRQVDIKEGLDKEKQEYASKVERFTEWLNKL